MTTMSRMGIPTDWKVNSSTSRTIKMDYDVDNDIIDSKDFWKSYSLVASPAM